MENNQRSIGYLEAVDTARFSALRLSVVTSILKERIKITKSDPVLSEELIEFVIDELDAQIVVLNSFD